MISLLAPWFNPVAGRCCGLTEDVEEDTSSEWGHTPPPHHPLQSTGLVVYLHLCICIVFKGGGSHAVYFHT